MCIREKKIPMSMSYLWFTLPGKTRNNFYFLSGSNFSLLFIINFLLSVESWHLDIFYLILAEHYSSIFNRLKSRLPPLFNYMLIFLPQNVCFWVLNNSETITGSGTDDWDNRATRWLLVQGTWMGVSVLVENIFLSWKTKLEIFILKDKGCSFCNFYVSQSFIGSV